MLKFAIGIYSNFKEKESLFLSSKTLLLSALLMLVSVAFVGAQETAKPQQTSTPMPSVTPAVILTDKKVDDKKADDKKTDGKQQKEAKAKQDNQEKAKKIEKVDKLDPNNPTAEQVAEAVVFTYGYLVGGRPGLQQIRKSSVERGKSSITNPDGSTELINYERRILRGDSLDKERIRIDQESPSSKYALIYNDKKLLGIFNESIFTPRDDAAKAFENQMWHGIEALLRYKENGATVTLTGRDKRLGVEYHILELTDKENRKTKYYVSTKSFRVAWLEYSENDVKYTRRFYDFRFAQGTLVPYRTVLLANDKQVEETTILTVTYGQKVEEDVFVAG